MKTAILISGHMRSFDRCLPTLHWHVFRHFVAEGQGAGGREQSPTYNADPARGCVGWYSPGGGYIGREKPTPESTCDFYVSTEPDEDCTKAALLEAQYPGAKIHIDTEPQPGGKLLAMGHELARHAAHAPYAISVEPMAVLGQLWRLQRVWDFFQSSSGNPQSAIPHDTIIRCRPDLWMESFRYPSAIKSPAEWLPPFAFAAWTPWWGRFGGVNDRFALLGAQAAQAYFTTWSQIPALLAAGCPLHPESLIKAALEAGNCTNGDTLDVSFSTLRADGERRFPEIMAQDIARPR